PLATALDGGGDFVGLGGAEDEDVVLGGFLHGLEQSVEGRGREHVDFVDDVDLLGAAHGAVDAVGDEFAGVLDGVVAGGVDLDDVDIAPCHDRLGDLPGLIAGGVDGLGEDAGHGGFANAPGAY